MYGWSILILWRDCKQQSESENIVKYVYSVIKASLIAFALVENIVVLSGSLAENTTLLIAAATASYYFKNSFRSI